MTALSGRLAVLSCVHGNLAALEAVMADVAARGIDQLACLGDLVGYGPYPEEVVAYVRAHGIRTVRGCWDEGIAADRGDCGCAFISEEEAALGHEAYGWTRRHVGEDARRWLGELPFAEAFTLACGDRVVLCHGSPQSTSEYLLESTHELVLLERAARAGCDMLICGHTHVPYARRVGGVLTASTMWSLGADPAARHSEVELRPKVIVNAGSVGEPRHGGLDATYVIVDGDTGLVEVVQVPYDVAATARAMAARGAPVALIGRLVEGRELTGKRKEVACAC
jgi:predicted phosphodiesterase